jgi:hypothetical protein
MSQLQQQLHQASRPAVPTEALDEIPRVVAAAIKGHDGIVVSLPAPARHEDVMRHMAHDLDHPLPILGEKGFLLSDGSFARRARARMFAELNNQLLPKASQGNELYSDDVW